MAADADTATELAALRARVAELEAELAETQRSTAALVARTQERVYWLDRLGVDLNALMRRPGAVGLLSALKGVRAVRWRLVRASRQLRGVQ